MTEKLTYDPTPADAPELSEDEQNSLEVADKLQKEEVDLLAGKFQNAQELENAYIELQKKLGSQDSKETDTETKSGSGPMFALAVNLVGVAISFLSTRVSGLLTLGSGFLATFCGRDGLFFCI